ncbi:RNA-binding protein 34, putative [Trypanosoma equiperdum]|uniref:RRM domain-containing protein n=3 Tax=Trypanozoon TaxID=39700 RepID=Q386H7_TRYB2|nr:hypothetical protein, conserved [Trypanosoma brucei gambiense DAL972]XP_828416.1 hypothetical protein, conserved [Trypanosoma brucei brucei TREU927]EAN79304.1 hypothetical protein, conserved [Trypanosoma brucei brucei TREU927]CBH17259.1 hypothetical protein, conserved [Trypanosoma brucei gambiense DAL972]SCU69490.1 RNA-binding protein 34, putative [Trypanosoma equiperdum]|eukprot:XP_011779523.1 hypothetical protein, conserved [Trypanosoma brucei gambiense DAL972]
MSKLFISKLPKTVSAEEVKEFLENLMPEATRIQLLLGSQHHEHKGYAYAHFAGEEAATEALQRLCGDEPPSLHGVAITAKRASRVSDAVESDVTPLPAALAHFSHSQCVTVAPPSLVDELNGVVARCSVNDNLEAVAFATGAEAAACVASSGGRVVKCTPPRLPELLASREATKRRREEPPVVKSGEAATEGSAGDIVTAYERLGYTALSPSQLLQLVEDFLEGRGRVAVQDREGHVALLNLPAYISALE